MAKPLISKKKLLAAQQLLERAINLHRMGLLAEAEQFYRQALDTKPRDAQAQHMFGVLRAQQNRLDEALELVGAALKGNPSSFVALSDLGLILHKLGRDGDALSRFDQALAIRPDHAPALSNRGNALVRLGRHVEALASYDRALALKSDYPEALTNRGHALAALGRHEEALASYAQALALRPGDGDALHGHAATLCVMRRYEEALGDFGRALRGRPHSCDLHYDRANALAALRRYEEAIAGYEAALSINPGNAAALANRGSALLQLRRYDEALASYDAALLIEPDNVAALNNRGTVLKELKRHGEALASYDRALAIRSDFADALYNRANLFKDMRRYDDALAAYDAARLIDPDHPDADGLIDAVLAVCDWTRIDRLDAELATRIEAGTPFTPFALLGFRDDPVLHLKCAKSYIADRISTTSTLAGPVPITHGDKIRIAYLSADFHDHATAFLIAGLFELHDRARFEITGVSFGREDDSVMRRRLVSGFDQFHDVRTMGDRDVALLLRGIGIDIAIDLKGYTQGSRPEIFAFRPAPIQVSYLGYPGTMGSDFIDYVIADQIVLPFDQQPLYPERIVHLPECYQVNDRNRSIGTVTPSRREAGLPENGFVFCCFNNSYKISRPVFEVWMRLLRAVPGSVLWLLGDSADAERNLRREAQAMGIDAARLIFAERVKLDAHLARHRLADLFLDTLPYNAHTTASDALWAGLPLVTSKGRAFAGRVAASLLHALGLPELATENLADYEALALRLASDPARLAAIREKLAANLKTQPLFDTDRFRRHLEAAFVHMWEIRQRGEVPQSFAVAPIDAASR